VVAKKLREEDDGTEVGQDKYEVVRKKPWEARATPRPETNFTLVTPLHIICQCYLYLLYFLQYTKL
jgi:hypothetical protein